MRGCLGPRLVGVDGVLYAGHDMIVDPILDIRRRIGCAEQPLVVRVVFGEQQLRISVAMQHEAAELGMPRFNCDSVLSRHLSQGRFRLVRPPSPSVSEPQGRQHMQAGSLRPAIVQVDLDQDIGRRRLRVFHEHVKIAIVIEDPSIK
jgi:hypothetical protein